MLSKKYQSTIESSTAFMVKIEDLVREIAIQNGIPYYRIESSMEHYPHMGGADTYMPVIRIITYFEDTVNQVTEILRKEFEITKGKSIDKKKDRIDSFSYNHIQYVANLKANRRGLTEYKRCGDKKFELQLCSMLQDAWSGIERELGYENASDESKRNFYRVGALLEMVDLEFLKMRSEAGKKYEQKIAASQNQEEFTEEFIPLQQDVEAPQPILTFEDHVNGLAIVNEVPEKVEDAIHFINVPEPQQQIFHSETDLSAVLAEPVFEKHTTPIAEVVVNNIVAQPQPVQEHKQVFVNYMPEQPKPVYEQPQVIVNYIPEQPKAVYEQPQAVVNNITEQPKPVYEQPQAVVNNMPEQSKPVYEQLQAVVNNIQEQPKRVQEATHVAAPEPKHNAINGFALNQFIVPKRFKPEVAAPVGIAPKRVVTPIVEKTVNSPEKADMKVNSNGSLAIDIPVEHKVSVTERFISEVVNAAEQPLPAPQEQPQPVVLPHFEIPALPPVPEYIQPIVNNQPPVQPQVYVPKIENIPNVNLNGNGNGIAAKIPEIMQEPVAPVEKAVPVYEGQAKANNKVAFDENAPMTDASLREYVMNSKLLKEVDQRIAERAGAKINQEIDIEGDVERLRFLKVFTLKQLQDRITDNKNDIVSFAEKWIGKDNGGSFDTGISLFYLEYLLVGKKNDPAFAIEYVVKFISDNDYSARYIIPTYNSIRSSDVSNNFSHLTLKA